MNKSFISWAVYDIANTVFNMGVVGLFLPLWINHREGSTDADLGFPVAASMVIVLVSSPFLGALTDRLKSRILTFTVLNIAATGSIFVIGITENVPIILMFFSVSFVSVYLAELLYNAMLVEASTPENRGKLGGIGIGLGYMGSLVVILLALLYGEFDPNYNFAFLAIAGIFILASLPITIFFIEDKRYHSQAKKHAMPSFIWFQIKWTWVHFSQRPKLLWFFISRYVYMIPVTTSGTFAVLYGIKTIGFNETEVELVLLLGTLFAIPGAMLWGYVVDKIGPSHTLKWNIFGWSLLLTGAFSIPLLNLNNQLWWPLSIFTGLCLGGLWAADRPLLIELSPSNLGEMFGIYGTVSRLAYLTGAFMWPFISVNMGLGQPAAIFFLTCCSLLGLALLIKFQNS